jgi:hypothetical protein
MYAVTNGVSIRLANLVSVELAELFDAYNLTFVLANLCSTKFIPNGFTYVIKPDQCPIYSPYNLDTVDQPNDQSISWAFCNPNQSANDFFSNGYSECVAHHRAHLQSGGQHASGILYCRPECRLL